jgi:enoyl-CoA hydratase/carnithine racemase
VAAESATFGMTEVPTGVVGPYYLAINDIIPWAIATEFALLGKFFTAQRLYELGMVNRVVPDDKLMDVAREYAEQFVSLPQEVLGKTKELMVKTRFWPRGEIKEEHIRANQWFRQSRHDRQEAVRAFGEKRAPEFTDSRE